MKIHTFLFQLLLLLIPVQLGIHFWPNWAFINGIRSDYLSPTLFLNDILFFFLLLFWLIDEIQKKSFSKITIPFKHIAFVLFFVVLNIAFSYSPWVSLFRWLRVLEISLLLLYVYRLPTSFRQRIPLLLTLSALWTSLLALMQFTLQRSVGGIFYFLGERTFAAQTPGIALLNFNNSLFLRPYATFPHPNALGGFLLVSMILFINSKYFKKFNVFLFIPLFVVFILTYSQASMIALLGVVVIALLKKFTSFPLFHLLLFSFVIVSLLTPLFINNLPLPSTESYSVRRDLSLISGRVFADSPIVGVGLGAFSIAAQENAAQALSFLQNPIFRFQPVHNIFLLAVTEIGILGMLLLVYLFWQSFYSKNTCSHYALLAVIITGLFDHYWLSLYQPSLVLAVLLGLALVRGKVYNSP